MPDSSILVKINKPLQANKRLFGLITIAILIIGSLGVGYYYHIKSNQENFRRNSFQLLDSYYEKVSRQIENDILSVNATKREEAEENRKKVFDLIKDREGFDKNETRFIDPIQERFKNESPDTKIEYKQELIERIQNQHDSTKASLSPKSIHQLDSIFNKIRLETTHGAIKYTLDRIDESLRNDIAFDEYINKYSVDTIGTIKIKPILHSSLLGLIELETDMLIDTSGPIKTGVAMAIQMNSEGYHLFSRQYTFKSEIDTDVTIKIILTGLVDAKRYIQKTRMLDPWVIVLLTAFLILCLFGLPFFKMVFISEEERLFSRDVIMAGISVVVSASIVMAMFLTMSTYIDEIYFKIPDKLEELGDSIQTRFEKENRAILEGLDSVDWQVYQKIIRDKRDHGCPDSLFYEPIGRDTILRDRIKYISKLDKKGKIDYSINYLRAPSAANTPVSLNHRSYYKDIESQNNVWNLQIRKGDLNKAKQIDYVMRPVVSIEDKTEEAVYIVSNDSASYNVASVQLKSIHDPTISFGYQFAIIDEKGEVWFHSKEGRSTLENFFKVSRRNKDLEAAIQGRVASSGSLKYHDESQLYYVRPILGTNLSVIGLYDVGLLRVQASEILSITSLAILMAFLLIGVFVIASVLIKKKHQPIYKYRPFIFEFLTPKYKHKELYRFLTTLFSSIIVILVFVDTMLGLKPTEIFVTLVLLIASSYFIVYTLLGTRRLLYRFRHIRNGIFILFVGSALYSLMNISSFQEYGKSQLLVVVFSFVIFIIFRHLGEDPVNWTRVKGKISDLFGRKTAYRNSYITFLFTWLVLVSVFPTVVFFRSTKTSDLAIWSKMDQFHLATSYADKKDVLNRKLTPVEGKEKKFEKIYPQHLTYGQYVLSNDVILEEELPESSLMSESTPDTNVYRSLLWAVRPIFHEKIRTYQALAYAHATDNSWRVDKDTLNLYTNSGRNAIIVKKIETASGEADKVSEKMRNAVVWPGIIIILFLFYGLISFYVDRCFGFSFMGKDIQEFDPKKAGIKRNRKASAGGQNGYLQKWATLLESESANSGIIIIGLPYSGKTTFAKKIIEQSKYDQSKIQRISFLRTNNMKGDCDGHVLLKELLPEGFDLKEGSDSWKNSEVFILEHLGYNVKSFDSNRIKLRLISYLISLGKRVILNSEMYPSQILDFYMDQKDDKGHLSPELTSDYFSWRDILSAFPQVIIGISNEHEDLNTTLKGLKELQLEETIAKVESDNIELMIQPDKQEETSSIWVKMFESTKTFFGQIIDNIVLSGRNLPKEAVADVGTELAVTQESQVIELRKGASKMMYAVTQELGYGNFLPKLAPVLVANCTRSYVDEDEQIEVMLDEQQFVMQSQSMSYGYYTDIWNSLPGHERYMLYDLAKDSFMNIKNSKALFNLMKKGLIIWQGRPVIFNRSFANFVASSGMEKEALSIEYKNRGQGSWSTMRMVIYLIILTIIVFIMMGKPGMMDDFKSFYGVLAGFGTIIPLLARFLFMGNSK